MQPAPGGGGGLRAWRNAHAGDSGITGRLVTVGGVGEDSEITNFDGLVLSRLCQGAGAGRRADPAGDDAGTAAPARAVSAEPGT